MSSQKRFSADIVHHEDQPVQAKRSWKGYLWDTWDLPQKERKLLFKVDGFILTLFSVGFFIKNLDQSNVNSAFLSGMKEDLSMNGNELVYAVSIWTAGYIIGQIPLNLLLTRVDPRWVIPTVELGWGVLTVSTYAIKNVKQLYAIRFFIGLLEAGYYPGLNYIAGSWYTQRELGKRAMIFWLAGLAGEMFSGYLQAAAYNNLNGVLGHAGWRWLFVIDAVITFPIAIIGYFIFPSLPLQGKKVWWLNDEEYELSRQRMIKDGKTGRTAWTWPKFRRVIFSWHTWVLPALYAIWMNSSVQQPMGYWLKSFNVKKNPPVPGVTFTVAQINTLPTIATALFIVMALIWAWLSDGPLRGRRWPFLYAGSVYVIMMALILRNRDLYSDITGTKVLYWFVRLMSCGGPLIITWINELTSDDTEKRAIIIAAALALAYTVNAIAPNFVWKTVDFPQAKKGMTYAAVMSGLLIIWTTLTLVLSIRDERRKAALGTTSKEAPASPSSDQVDIESKSIEGDNDSTSVSAEGPHGQRVPKSGHILV
ncbi:uncharacterized protein IL334_007032 [Kwoniella shivajii]|uniref:Major facilitator superfamily (MFS) profile domain-containing protein n=1 Tax=Kwoniella shivajii TaxID=564305 RepID=A0ABZ1D815_9TREE|nr:hypothetical protein IL334_007032 [Kwoniella shivajii]